MWPGRARSRPGPRPGASAAPPRSPGARSPSWRTAGAGGHIPPSSGGAGGTGSTNTVHFNGGAGGAESAAFHGQGGGSSAGTASAGNAVSTDVKTAALAVAGGGPGGPGGNSTSPYYGYRPESGPGGGGGGGGANNKNGGNGGHGADGQIILTWSVSSPTELGLTARPPRRMWRSRCSPPGPGPAACPPGRRRRGRRWTASAAGTTDGMTIFPYWRRVRLREHEPDAVVDGHPRGAVVRGPRGHRVRAGHAHPVQPELPQPQGGDRRGLPAGRPDRRTAHLDGHHRPVHGQETATRSSPSPTASSTSSPPPKPGRW